MEKITVALVACLALTINSECLEEIFVNEEDEIIPQKAWVRTVSITIQKKDAG